MNQCKACDGFFTVSWIGVNVPGGKEREEVDCPHCGETAYSEMTPLSPQVSKATDAQVAAFQANNG
jgi:hypothetical protein